MKNILKAVALISLFAAGAAQAESPTAWPRYPADGIDGGHPSNTGRIYRAAPAATTSAWTAPTATFSDWKALPAGSDAGGQSQPDAETLDALRLSHRDYWLRRNSEIFATGEPADVLPVRVYERLNADAFGGPVMSGE